MKWVATWIDYMECWRISLKSKTMRAIAYTNNLEEAREQAKKQGVELLVEKREIEEEAK